MRGLDSTCTLPCASRKSSSAAKLWVWNARPNRLPPGTPGITVPATALLASVRLIGSEVRFGDTSWPVVPREGFGPSTPLCALPLGNAARSEEHTSDLQPDSF